MKTIKYPCKSVEQLMFEMIYCLLMLWFPLVFCCLEKYTLAPGRSIEGEIWQINFFHTLRLRANNAASVVFWVGVKSHSNRLREWDMVSLYYLGKSSHRAVVFGIELDTRAVSPQKKLSGLLKKKIYLIT